MTLFLITIISVLMISDVLWWRWARGLLSTVPHSKRYRAAISAVTALAILSLCLIGASRFIGRGTDSLLPRPFMVVTLVWHLLALPAALLAGIVRSSAERAIGLSGERSGSNDESQDLVTRRAFLARTAVATPVAVAALAAARSASQVDEFRVRAIELPIRNLPSGLEGLSIAHVSDTHLGRITTGKTFARIVAAVNDMDADLVLHTGDLINNDQGDLPQAADFMRAMRGRHGVFMCEGNHDLIEGREPFESFMRRERMPILIDEAATIRINGVDVDILGLAWTRGGRGSGVDGQIAASVSALAARRSPGAFPILLAHHPHAFDAAVTNGVPLTLAGHTHGGQLQLSHGYGFGPMMYRYWSGAYERDGRTCVVSNGAGNWFPLRINAPAEIVRLTLKRA